MSANSLPELQAVAEVVADGQKKKAGRKRKVRKPLIIDKDLQRVSESIGAFSARQFGKVLSRAVSGAPDDSSAYAAAMNGMSLVERMDGCDCDEHALIPEQKLLINVMTHAMKDLIGSPDCVADSYEREKVRQEADDYFWGDDPNNTLFDHLRWLGIELDYLRKAVARAEEYVFRHAPNALAHERATGKRMTKTQLAAWLIEQDAPKKPVNDRANRLQSKFSDVFHAAQPA